MHLQGLVEVGEATAHALAQYFGGYELIENTTEETLQEVSDIGPIVAANIAGFFTTKT